MPPPLQSDTFIRKICPEFHPPDINKLYNITSLSTPKYKKNLPGIKVSAPYVVSPVYIDTMAKQLSSDRGNNQRALIMARERVISEYAKPSPDIDKLLSQTNNLRSNNLRGNVDVMPNGESTATNMLSNISETLRGASSYRQQ